MTTEQRLTDLFEELERQTVMPHDLYARIATASTDRRRVPVLRIALALAACVLAIAALPYVFDGNDDRRVTTTPLATASAAAFNEHIAPVCTTAARALTAVEPRFATVAAYKAASERFHGALAPLTAALVGALPPRDDLGLPSRVVAGIRTAEGRVSGAAHLAGDGDISGAGEAFSEAQREIDDALRELVDHGARCSVIGTED